jgi:secondary thiamine-phosphate synthase enzyme
MSLNVKTDGPIDVVDVTDQVASAVPAVEAGVCTVFVNHTTAAVSINEAEPRLIDDIEQFVGELSAPDGWEHDALDGNADAHLRSSLLGRSVSVPVRDGALALGTWQSVLLIECDGPRDRSLSVTVVPGVAHGRVGF